MASRFVSEHLNHLGIEVRALLPDQIHSSALNAHPSIQAVTRV